MIAAHALKFIYTFMVYLFPLYITTLLRALWAGMDNAKKALHDSESISRSESHNDSGIYVYISP